MSFQEITDRVAEDYSIAQKKMKTEGEKALKTLFVKLFEEVPEIHSVSWYGYVPSWNDGDACTFSMGGLRYSLSNVEKNLDDEDDFGDDEEEGNPFSEPLKKKLVDDFEEAFNSLPEELFTSVFGDNFEIKVTRNGFEVGECDRGY